MSSRTEKDFIGEKSIPSGSFYGIHSARSYENFGESSDKNDKLFLRAYMLVKKAAAITNFECGYFPEEKCDMICTSADHIIFNELYDDFIVNPIAGGAGTSLNMNINEVLANYGLYLSGKNPGEYHFLSPVDDVNMHQSTNDTFPTAFRIAVLWRLAELERSVANLQSAFQDKEREFVGVTRLGRTELQDAIPMSAGMMFSAYAEAFGRDRWRIFKSSERIKTVNLGGTATGTGFNAPQKYIFRVTDKLRELAGVNISRSENLVDATQNLDSVVEVSAILKALAVNLLKISGDLRLLSSGPSGGIGEVILPVMQEGSSIMPGKANPVIPEYVSQVAILVIANDSAISAAAAGGNMELNQFYPLISHLLLKNLKILDDAVRTFTERCVSGIKLNYERIKENLDSSVAIITYLSKYIGHENASAVYRRYLEGERDIRRIIVESGFITSEKYDELMKPGNISVTGFK